MTSVETRVVLVEDHLLLAQVLARALGEVGLDAVVAGTNPDEVLALTQPGTLVLLDLDLDGRDGSALVPTLRSAGARVLVLTGSRDLLAIGRSLDAGATDVLDKALPFDDLVTAIAAASAGDPPPDPATHQRVVRAARARHDERSAARAVLDRLTPREHQVLEALAAGGSAEAIAAAGVVSLSTVRSQIRSILAKLEVHSQLAAVARARDLRVAIGDPQD